MNDLNNIYYFAKIVEHGSLSAAAEAVGVAKSVLSQHLAKLEADLGMRLIQRTTRKLQVTDVGRRYYERCRAVLVEVDRAGSVIDDAREIPRGLIRMATPINFAQIVLGPVLAAFMAAYPEVQVVLDETNRDVDLIADAYDVALRIVPHVKSSSMISRSFLLNRHILVAHASVVARCGLPNHPDDLRGFPSVGGTLPVERGGRYLWHLTGPAGESRSVSYQPRLVTEDLSVLKNAVLAGCGVADFPRSLCSDELADGRLVQLLPHWQLPELKLYVVYPSRGGLSLAARALIDYLGENLRPVLDSLTSDGSRMRLMPPLLDAAKFGT